MDFEYNYKVIKSLQAQIWTFLRQNIWWFHDPIIGTCFPPKQWLFGYEVMNGFEWSRSALVCTTKYISIVQYPFHNRLKRLRLMISCENERSNILFRFCCQTYPKIRVKLWCNDSFPFITNLYFKDSRVTTRGRNAIFNERKTLDDHCSCRIQTTKAVYVSMLLFVSPRAPPWSHQTQSSWTLRLVMSHESSLMR